MSYQNPHSSKAFHGEYDHAVAPEPAAEVHPASPFLIGAYFVAAAFLIFVVLYGLNHQRNETEETGAATAVAPTENAAPPPAPTQQPNAQQGNQGGNPPAKQPQQNSQQPATKQNQQQPAPKR